jgi:hypothetical protein
MGHSAQEKSIEGIGQIPADLLHPPFIRAGRQASKVNTPARYMHDEQKVIRYQTMLRPDLDGGEVNRPENIPVGLEKSLPSGLMLSVRCRLDAVCFENISDGCVGDPVSKVGERPLDAIVAPGGILLGNAEESRVTSSGTGGRPGAFPRWAL